MPALGWKAQRRWRAWMRALLLGIAVLVFMLPLVWTALASFGLTPDDTGSPPTWSLPPTVENYTGELQVAEPTFLQELATSAGLSIVATLLTTAVAFMAAYSLVRSRFRGKRLLVQCFLVLASLPVMAFVIPLGDLMRHLRLEDTFGGIALAEAAVYAPLAIYVLYGYLSRVSIELEEAARLDGATPLQIVGRIVLPTTAPGVTATAIIVFVLEWNLFLVPLILTVHQIKTVPVALSDFFTFERELTWSTAAAALTVWLLPVIALVAVAHGVLERFTLAPADRLA